jgi:hypothetical protein
MPYIKKPTAKRDLYAYDAWLSLCELDDPDYEPTPPLYLYDGEGIGGMPLDGCE